MFYDNLTNNKRLERSAVEPSNSPQADVGFFFEKLLGKVQNIPDDAHNSRTLIQKLESELAVYKRAYTDLEAEHQLSEQLRMEADKQRNALVGQLKGHRVIVLVDGDGAIFNSRLLDQGQSGGHIAAEKLSGSIITHLTANYGSNPYQLWVSIFLNKEGLFKTLFRAGIITSKGKLDEFITGFNQAAVRFTMLDVGSAKEAADAKIKAILEDEIRLPQTEKIIFAGCHDNGYATTLRSQITAGFKHKLILLRGYSDMAAEIDKLRLPSFSVPKLFMAKKLVATSPRAHNNGQPSYPSRPQTSSSLTAVSLSPSSCIASQPPVEATQPLWDDTLRLAQLLTLSSATAGQNTDLEDRIALLELELFTWKQATETSEREVKALDEQIATLKQQISHEDSLKINKHALIVCVINGDELVFNPVLLAQGYAGGRAAAQKLAQRIVARLSSEGVQFHGQLSCWTTIYVNRTELADDLAANKLCTHEQLQAFFTGFTQASTRFSIVDTGQGKDSLEAKIQEHLQTYAYFPQTLRVFFGGYDPGAHLKLFCDLARDGTLGKFIILHASQEAAEVLLDVFSIPRLILDGLFLPEKILRALKNVAPLATGSSGL